MPTYPRLPVTGTALGQRQFSLRQMLIGCTILAIVLESLIVGGLPRLLANLLGAIALAFASTWLISRLRPSYAFLAFLLLSMRFILLTSSRIVPIPPIMHALERSIDGTESDLDIVVLIGCWHGCFLLMGAFFGWLLALMRAKSGAFA